MTQSDTLPFLGERNSPSLCAHKFLGDRVTLGFLCFIFHLEENSKGEDTCDWSVRTVIKALRGMISQGWHTIRSVSSTSSQRDLVFSQPFAATRRSVITIAAFRHWRWDKARTAGTHQASKHTCWGNAERKLFFGRKYLNGQEGAWDFSLFLF